MKSLVKVLLLGGFSMGLAACGTMQAMHDKLADMTVLKQTLANGKTVYVDYNVNPSAAWQCRVAGHGLNYSWMAMQTEGSFSLGGPRSYVMKKALDYANQKHLNVNYINITLPDERTVSTTTGNMTAYRSLDPNSMVAIEFFRCQKINPDHILGGQKSTDFNVSVK